MIVFLIVYCGFLNTTARTELDSHVVTVCVCVCVYKQTVYIQGVTGGTDQTSGECSLGQTIPI